MSTWVVFKKWQKLNNFRYTESEEKRISGVMLTFIPFKNFDQL
jgi:hypothetical protein